MCRNIKTLFNFEPIANKEEIEGASLQYVRKISGSAKPSKVNEEVFNRAVKEVARATRKLVRSLKTKADPRNREVEAKKAHERAKQRFNLN